jgi:8-amino-7-oxononanoate synthase
VTDDSFDRLIEGELIRRRERDQLRRRSAVHVLDATHVEIDGRTHINFCSNNYLGLTHHPRLIEAGVAAMRAAGVGSGAAGLISGYTDIHAAAENALARWKNMEAAVLLPSGYQANVAAVQTFAAVAGDGATGAGHARDKEDRDGDGDCGGHRSNDRGNDRNEDCGDGGGDAVIPLGINPTASKSPRAAGVRFLLDKLVHASLIDAVRATKLPMRVFPHNGMGKLRRLLENAPAGQTQVVVTESIFSMDGDAADLPALAELKKEFAFQLLLDEAHATGIYGPRGQGYAAEIGAQAAVDVSIVTLSKAMGGCGGAVCCAARFRDALLNLGRAYIYSTSVSPATAAVASAAIDVIVEEPARRERVRRLAIEVRRELSAAGWNIPRGDSPIIPIILGAERAALEASAKLKVAGLLVLAVRPPTVAPNASRLRVTLSSAHADDEIQALLNALASVK